MKLFVIAALIAVSAAGRLEHLERSYLPPSQANQAYTGGSGFGSHGSGASGFGSSGLSSHGGFGSSGSLGSGASNYYGAAAAARSGPSANYAGSHPGATSNQYLPPNFGSAGSNEQSQFGGSSQGFNSQRYPSQQYGAPQASQYSAPQQYSAPSSLYGTPQFGASAHGSQGQAGARFGSHSGSSFGSQAGSPFGSQSGSSFGSQARYQPQNSAASRQYLTPKVGSNQNTPQQAFDEETGYHY